MQAKEIVIWLAVLLASVSASAQDKTEIPFVTAKNYFVRNNYSGLDRPDQDQTRDNRRLRGPAMNIRPAEVIGK